MPKPSSSKRRRAPAPRLPAPNRRRLEREVESYAAAVRDDFMRGHRAIVQLSEAERVRALT